MTQQQNTQSEAPAPEDWSVEWPTLPGMYLFAGSTTHLFLGRQTRPLGKTRIVLVEAVLAGGSNAPHMLYLGGGFILYREEWEGVWKPFVCAIPDIDALLGRK